MSTAQVRKDREQQIAENAAKAFAEHVVTVEHESGLHRHYRCAKPGTGVYAFHVVTFPGRLIVSGDIGNMGWNRCDDMLEWAAGSVESTSYFAEKTWGSIEVLEWSADAAIEAVERDHAERHADADDDDDREKVDEVRDELVAAAEESREAFVDAFYRSDWYDGDFPNTQDYTAEFLWCREAVRWFLKWYAANRPTAPVPA